MKYIIIVMLKIETLLLLLLLLLLKMNEWGGAIFNPGAAATLVILGELLSPVC
jgi:hypothetical protein